MFAINRSGREPLYISLPDFDKGHRCPGNSGEGMRRNKADWCNNELAPGQSRWSLVVRAGARPPQGIEHATELPGFYSWRIRRTNCCDTIVLPQFLYLFTAGAWFYWMPGGTRMNGERYRGSLRLGSGWQKIQWQWWKVRRIFQRRAV